MEKRKELKPKSIITFGKYKNNTVEYVHSINPQYLEWFITVFDGIITDELTYLMKPYLKPQEK